MAIAIFTQPQDSVYTPGGANNVTNLVAAASNVYNTPTLAGPNVAQHEYEDNDDK